MTKEQILDRYPDQEFLFADGFDDCILGLSDPDFIVVYSSEKCIEKLKKDGMSHEEAVEYFDFNVAGAYVGKRTPIFCDTLI